MFSEVFTYKLSVLIYAQVSDSLTVFLTVPKTVPLSHINHRVIHVHCSKRLESKKKKDHPKMKPLARISSSFARIWPLEKS